MSEPVVDMAFEAEAAVRAAAALLAELRDGHRRLEAGANWNSPRRK